MLLDFRLFPSALCVWAFTLVFLFLPQFSLPLLFLLSLCFLIAAGIVFSKKRSHFFSAFLCFLLILFSFCSVQIHRSFAFPSSIQSAIENGDKIELVAKIESSPTFSSSFGTKKCSFQMSAQTPISQTAQNSQETQNVQASQTAQNSQLSQTKQPTQKTQNLQNSQTPQNLLNGRFKITAQFSGDSCDSEKLEFSSLLKISGTAKPDDFHFSNAAKIEVKDFEQIREMGALTKFFNLTRKKAVSLFSKFQIENPKIASGTALALGMSLGDKRLMDSSQTDNAKIAGLTHLTAISGTHFVIVISAIAAIFAPLIRNRRAVALLQLVAVAGMVCLVHPTDSVKRAALMSAIALLGVFSNRQSQSIACLSFVVIAWILFDPFLATSFGFGLSCSAAASIVLFSKKCSDFLSSVIGKTAAELLSVPLVAQIGCSPILLLMNSYLTPLAPFANLAVLAVVEPSTLFSFLSVLLSAINPFFANVLLFFASLFTSWIVFISEKFANFPFAKIPWPSGLLGAVCLLSLCLFVYHFPKLFRFFYSKITGFAPKEETALFVKMHKSIAKKNSNFKKFLKTRLIFSIICAFLLVTAVSLIIVSKNITQFSNIPKNFLFAACDVGQGDAGVIRTGKNSAIVFDVGPEDNSTGGRGIDNCLTELKIEKIDLIILSHYHSDHIGGLKNAIKGRKVESALINPVMQPEKESLEVEKVFKDANIPTQKARGGMQGQFGCQENSDFCTKWQVVSVWDDKGENGELFENGKPMKSEKNSSKSAGEDDRENDSSIAVLFEINNVTLFGAGDLELKGSKGALEKLKNLNVKNVDILKVNHHGSKTQNQELLKLLNPKVSVYMVGKNNYGHPNSQTVSFLENLGSISLRTDKKGICGVLNDEEGELSIFCEN